MEKRHGEKYAALRAAAEARQRQRGASAASASSAAVSGSAVASASGGSAVASSLADGDARYARLQELQAQQRERKARSMAAGEIGSSAVGSSASKLEAASASGISAGGPPGTGAALPPRPRQPTASTAAAAGTIKNSNYNSGGNGSFGSGATKTATPAAKPHQRSAHPKLYSTPGAAVLEPSREAEAGKVGSKYYATPLRKENVENDTSKDDEDAWRIPADRDIGGEGKGGGEALSPKLSPKTPMTMMRAVRASLGEDRTAIETGRGGLFGTTGGGAEGGEGGNVALGEDLDAGLDDSKIEDAKSPADEHPHRPISASCLPYPSDIVLRVRHPAVLASLSVQPQSVRTDRGCFVANEAHGGLGGIDFRGENRFTISKDRSSDASDGGLASNTGGAMEGEQEGEEDFSKVLCYGDKVTLRSNVLRRVLGVQKSKAPADNEEGAEGAPVGSLAEGQGSRLEVGCFRKEGRLGTAWTVLRGGAHAPVVRLGTDDALDLDAAAVQGEGSETSKAWRKVPVHSGDPVVLRNEWTGGLLSLGTQCAPMAPVDGTPTIDDGTPPGWHLEVLTSSYQATEDGGASTANDRPLLEYLHEHRRFRPGRNQTFQLVAADVPACPAWAYPTGEGADRMYLHGGYLSHPDRHELEAELEGEVFPDAVGAREQPERDCPPLAVLPVDVQERILADEVLGAMMGQEGRFLRYQLAGDDDDDDAESQSSEESQVQVVVAAAGFGVAPASILGGPLDPSLENLVARLLPLATHHARVGEYVAAAATQYEFGVVARALAEAIGELLEEYLAFASDLDRRVRDEKLSLSAVHVRARPALRTMAVLSRAVAAARDKKGGALLNALHEMASVHFAGDEMGHKLLQHLLERAARPYASMLRSWLAHGRVHDPYKEFMIEVTDRSFGGGDASSFMRKGTEWHRWCRERPDHVPFGMRGSESDAHVAGAGAPGLDRGRATAHMGAVHKAHAAGKYWRAIRRCREGGEMVAGAEPSRVLAGSSDEEKKKATGASRDEEEARVLLDPLQLSRSIDRAYHEASDAMLRLLLHDHGLLSSLRFMKKYFLLDQGDFFVDFLDGAESELHKELPDVLRGRVQNWLSASLARTADATSPGLAAALRCTFHHASLRDTLDDLAGKKGGQRRKKAGARPKVLAGFEAIAFEFKAVPFPASIVLSEPQLRIYQLVFRLIFFAKCVERRLVNMWSDHQGLKGMPGLRAACGPTFSLRRRMLHFIQNFVYYLKFDVIEPGWRELEVKLRATREYCREGAGDDARRSSTTDGRFPRTVDDLIHHHNDFLIRTSNQCLLTNYDLVDRASKIMTTCLLFATQIQRFLETTKVRELHEQTRHERSKLRYGPKRRKDDGAREAEFRSDREERTRRCADGIEAELNTETYRHMISRFDEVFSAHLAEFVRNLESDRGRKDNAHLSNLSLQLDYNGFLSSSMQGAKK